MNLRPLCVVALLLVCGLTVMAAQVPDPPEALVTTTHQIILAGKPVTYTATAGRIPIINNEAGEPHGYLFFVAYTVEPKAGAAPRPLTFAWNGGPGSSSSQVHLLAFGPKRLRTADTYPENPSLSKDDPLEDNQETWLDFTDLVFVDPIGTGYSRPTKPEYAAEFYNTVGDAEAVAEFIRVYRQRFDRFDSPLVLAGESYGTIRAQWVAEALQRRRTTVSAVALISGFLRLDQEIPPALEDALLVPRCTITAYYYKKLPSELQSGTLQQAVEKINRWVHAIYVPALERLQSANSLSAAEREAIITQLAQYTGVKPSLVDSKTLTIPSTSFTDRLLEDKGLDLGRYDTRMSALVDVNKIPWTTLIDPSLTPVMDVMQGTSTTLIRYLRSDLQYKSDLLYRGPFGESYPKPTTPIGDWMPRSWGSGANDPQGVPEYSPGLSGSDSAANIPLISPLHHAMELNPSMRVTIMTGMYDNAAPGIGCDYVSYAISRVDPKLRDRVTSHCYVGGHMMYTDKLARQQLKRDMSDLVHTAIPANSLSTTH